MFGIDDDHDTDEDADVIIALHYKHFPVCLEITAQTVLPHQPTEVCLATNIERPSTITGT